MAIRDIDAGVGSGGGDVPSTRLITAGLSLSGGGSLAADRTITLDNDAATPGASKVYGTDGDGVKGWKADPAGGTVTMTSRPDVDGHTGGTATDLDGLDITAFAEGEALLIRHATYGGQLWVVVDSVASEDPEGGIVVPDTPSGNLHWEQVL